MPVVVLPLSFSICLAFGSYYEQKSKQGVLIILTLSFNR